MKINFILVCMGKRILIVDDQDLCVLARNLRKECHEVVVANNGQNSLEALTSPIDIIFCDYHMPVMDGYEFTKQVRTNPKYMKYSKIPIIGIGDFPADKREYLDDCMEKPLDLEEILTYIGDSE